MLSLKKFLLSSVTFALLSLGMATSALADTVIFSNFGPGMTFSPSSGGLISHPMDDAGHVSRGQVLAHSFTSTGNFNFSSAQLALGLISGTNLIQVSLQTDAGGVPGTIIESLTASIGGPWPPGGVVTFNSTLNPLLLTGVNYWIVAYAPNVDTSAAWNHSLTDLSTANNFAFNQISSPTGPWRSELPGSRRSAFQINGTEAVPEPTTMLLLGSGLVGLAAKVGRRRLQGVP